MLNLPSPLLHSRPDARRPTLWARCRAALPVVMASVTGGLLALVLMNACDSPVPPPRFTEADLRPVPSATDNGWNIALAAAPPDPDDRAAAAAHASACERAFEQPRFADPCPIDESTCLVIPIFRCHQAVTRSAEEALGRGDVERAAHLSAALLRADHDALAGARSLLTHRLALAMLREALRVTVVVGASPAAHATSSAAAIREDLAALPPTLEHVSPGHIGAYLHALRIIDDAAQGDHGLLMRLLLDKGETRAALETSDGFGVHRGVSPTEETGWWVDNAAGDWLLANWSLPSEEPQRREYAAWRDAAHLVWR